MRKDIRCKKCHAINLIEYHCEICGKVSYAPYLTLIEDSGEAEYYFDSWKCLVKFVLAEETKRNPRKDIITG